MSPELPTRIDRYRILEMLGRGSMGYVYLAVDPKLDRRIALKVMSSHRLGEEDDLGELRMRFVQEARAAGRLTHPGIVTIYDADTDEATGWPYIAMELVGGPSLRARLRQQRPLEIRDSIQLIAQVARALDYAHSEGVVHRDIKPANLLLDRAGLQAKVADFGVAKLVSNSLTLTGQVLGSPNYMAPEQVKAQEIDGRTDLFGLGVVLYECLAGRSAFAADSLASITFKIVSVDPRPVEIYNPRVPPALGALVRRALEKRPEDRFQTGSEMADALESVARELDNLPEAARTREIVRPLSPDIASLPPDRDSPTLLGRRSAWRALAAAAVAVLALLAIIRWAVEPSAGELPLLTRRLGLFAEPANTPLATADDVTLARADDETGADTLGELTEEPSHETSQDALETADRTPSVSTSASTSASSPASTSETLVESGTEETEKIDSQRDRAPDLPPSTVDVVTAPETSKPAPKTAPKQAASIPQARLTISVENSIRLAMISVWVDGDRVLTRRLQTNGLLKRWVGQPYQFEVPVPAGKRKIEVHVSGLSSSLEARETVRADFIPGRGSVLEVDIDRRRKTLNLSWK